MVASSTQRGPARRVDCWRSREGGSWLVDGLVDRLVAQPHRPICRELRPQVSADLRRAPPLRQELTDDRPQRQVRLQSACSRLGPSTRGLSVRLERLVGAVVATIASNLTRDRRGRSTQLGRDRPDGQPFAAQVGDDDSLVLREVASADRPDRQSIKRLDVSHDLTTAVDLVAARPVRRRRPRDPHLPTCSRDRPSSRPELHEPRPLGRLRPATRPLLHTTHR